MKRVLVAVETEREARAILSRLAIALAGAWVLAMSWMALDVLR